MTPEQRGLDAAEVIAACLREANGDVASGLAAAEYILSLSDEERRAAEEEQRARRFNRRQLRGALKMLTRATSGPLGEAVALTEAAFAHRADAALSLGDADLRQADARVEEAVRSLGRVALGLEEDQEVTLYGAGVASVSPLYGLPSEPTGSASSGATDTAAERQPRKVVKAGRGKGKGKGRRRGLPKGLRVKRAWRRKNP